MGDAEREAAVASVVRRAEHLPHAHRLTRVDRRRRGAGSGTRVGVHGATPGNGGAVPVAVGEAVETGAPMVILESMKMEHVVCAPATGSVVSLAVDQGTLVAVGDQLAVMEASTGRP